MDMYPQTRRRRTLTGLAALLAAGAMLAGAQGACAASVALVDTPGSLAGIPNAAMISGPQDFAPTAHMTVIARAAAMAGPGQQLRGYACPQGAGVDMTCALDALQGAAGRGERVVNFSFSTTMASVPATFRERFAAAVAAARGRGVLVVAAAYPGGPTFPADLPGVLSVGAEDREGVPLHPDDGADMRAPGVDLPLTDGAGRPYAAFGSSFATAWTAAIAARLADGNPTGSADVIEAALPAALGWPAATGEPPDTGPALDAGTITLGARRSGRALVISGHAARGVRIGVVSGRRVRTCRTLPCRVAWRGTVPREVSVRLARSGRPVTVRVAVSRAGRVLRVVPLTALP